MQKHKEYRLNISLIKKGNQLEFTHLVNLYSQDLYIFASGFVKNSQQAEEVVSDVFIKLWESRLRINEIKDLKNYLFIAVRNSCLTFLNRRKKNEFSLDALSYYYIEKHNAYSEEYISSELVDQIYEAIEYLPPKCKLVFSMAKIQGFKRKEIASILDISEKTVEYHLKTAVAKILDHI
ncbi:MAG: RNA polymerase sigma-70 factor [Carboxylicivirga sp.]|jgi:RNA polymerase sigma-70 factor (ECF subfamily)|nr:RNA polymerase sigma-70 factor [Carboxylicivirga sp.]